MPELVAGYIVRICGGFVADIGDIDVLALSAYNLWPHTNTHIYTQSPKAVAISDR